MSYTLVPGKSEQEYRNLFIATYCSQKSPIKTFDGITVKFYPDMFNHAFYESRNWRQKDKSIFSNARGEKILWIKDALMDSSAKLKVGWDKKTKSYDNSRRVAVVNADYIVIIKILNQNNAKFISAFQANNSIGKINSSPNWQ